MLPIDDVRLNFDTDSIWILNLCLAVIMFGIALDLKVADFRNILKTPRPVLAGITSQFFLLPLMTLLLILVLKPGPSFALGMILVAACPGGNISNFMTHMAGGNTALSISLTAFATLAAIIMTPLNLQLYGSLYAPASGLLREVNLDILQVTRTIVLILGIPLVSGILIRNWFPALSKRVSDFLKPVSMLIFGAFVAAALYANWGYFMEYIHLVLFLVFLHNLAGILLGYNTARVFQLDVRDRKTIAIETGIQNSGLGLLLIFSFFDGLGGMAIIAAWWGIWHIISGLSLSWYWSRYRALQSQVNIEEDLS